MSKRASGILMHITSLPCPYGVGDLGPRAYAFVDALRAAGQTFWQILPVNPTDGINGHSPYSSLSAFAGNPLFISPQLMVIDGFLTASDLKKAPVFDAARVDHAKAAAFKERLFVGAYARWAKLKDKSGYDVFCRANAHWLEDYAVFSVAKSVFNGRPWNEWPGGLKRRKPGALKAFLRTHTRAVGQVRFVQFLFFSQWQRLKQYAKANGVGIIGDIPIYVNYDSADVWRHPGLFKLNHDLVPRFVSGCPPDYFSRTGQRWGNPVYDWANLKKEKYGWWVRRIRHNLALFDHLRIDHFRGFSGFWQIPAHEKLAVFGRWVKGPGADFFIALARQFKPLPIIAEDLGEITPDVPVLMRRFGFPGMRVLLFAFGGDPKTNPHAPARYTRHCVVYTGTHDNNTVQGWFRKEAGPRERANIAVVLKGRPRPSALHWAMIEALMRSKADTVIIPMADVLGLGEEGRMNTPATKAGNWQWRLLPFALRQRLNPKLRHLTVLTKRA
ncbi:MAG: 4-alpha-glucanotransferase [Candidatus Omnitrophica bacterium]|nr:4-alpha-glucanotransferase [Candidatus Omnitrophota bacterium]